MRTPHLGIIVVTLFMTSWVANNPVFGGCLVGNDWPDAPCHDLPGQTIGKETLRKEWAPYYQYKGAAWMEMMKTQMIDAIKNGTIKDWIGHSESTGNVWTYYSLNDQVPFFIQPGSQNYTKPDYVISPLQQFKSGTPIEDTQCKKNLVLSLKKDGSPVCVSFQSFPILLQRGFLLSDSYNQFALNEAKRFIHSSPTFESSGIENTLKLTLVSIEESLPPNISIEATFDSSSPGYGDKSMINVQQYLTRHITSITISNINHVTSAIIDHQWDEISQKFLKY